MAKSAMGEAKTLKIIKLLPLSIIFLIFAVWAVKGKIPDPAQGRAVILIPRSIVAIQPLEGGRVLNLKIKKGDLVKKGQLLATMDFPEQEVALQNKKKRLADLQTQNAQISKVQTNRTQSNQDSVQQKRQANLRQIESLKVQLAANGTQKKAYLDHLKYLNNFRESTDKRLQAYNHLAKEGVVPEIGLQTYFFQANQQTVNNSLNEIQVALSRLKGLDESLKAQIRSIEALNEGLVAENRTVVLSDTVSDATRFNLIADQKRDIKLTESHILTSSKVLSHYDGRVEEISTNPGEVVLPGSELGKISVINPKADANVIALFKVGDAKRLKPGMKLEVVPDLYDRARYGGIEAKVMDIDQQPVSELELVNMLGNKLLALKLLLGRDENNPDKPRAINDNVIKVSLKLEPDKDSPSGYKWSNGQGPPQKITDGTTSDALAILEERSLLSYLNPAFRWITGIY